MTLEFKPRINLEHPLYYAFFYSMNFCIYIVHFYFILFILFYIMHFVLYYTFVFYSMDKLRRETEESDAQKKKKAFEEGPNASFGYGGKFGVEKDRMDQSAVGHDYAPKLEKHQSQKDYSTGFGGKYGVQTDRVDKVKKTIISNL